jgi:hypothetical protein
MTASGPLGTPPAGEIAATARRESIPLPLEHASLLDEVRESIDVSGPADLQALRDELDNLAWRRTPAGDALAQALDRASGEGILTSAAALSREWLSVG